MKEYVLGTLSERYRLHGVPRRNSRSFPQGGLLTGDYYDLWIRFFGWDDFKVYAEFFIPYSMRDFCNEIYDAQMRAGKP